MVQALLASQSVRTTHRKLRDCTVGREILSIAFVADSIFAGA